MQENKINFICEICNKKHFGNPIKCFLGNTDKFIYCGINCLNNELSLSGFCFNGKYPKIIKSDKVIRLIIKNKKLFVESN